ncbi:type II secretion system minor pseudopilin GspK [Paraglaciecola aestuariivivens]
MNRSRLNPASKQQGVALIIVLLIVAIVSVLATEMGGRLQLQVKRASNIKETNQAYWYAMGAEQYARLSMQQLAEEEVMHLEQAWSQEFAYPIEGGGIKAQLVDLQSCFNLNALKLDSQNQTASPASNPQVSENGTTVPEQLLAFERLLDSLEGQVSGYNKDTLRDSLADWLDADSTPKPLGAEDSEYESRQFPYMAANNYMVHKSELRLVHGIELAWLEAVLDLVCVIPNNNLFLINVNTVTSENAAVIAAATGLSLFDAKNLIESRPLDGYESVEDFLNSQEILALNLTDTQKSWFEVKSSHFILYTQTQYNSANFAMQSLLKLDKDDSISVLLREFSRVR